MNHITNELMKIAKKRDRILSFIIDFLIYSVIILIFGYFFGEKNENGYHITGFPAFLLFLIGLGLWPLNEAFTGQTFGKMIVGLKVLNRSNYKDISGTQAFVRFGMGIFDSFFMIGLIVATTNKNKQRIGDLVADSIVIDINK